MQDTSDDELSVETLEKLDAGTIWLIRQDLLKHMRGLEALANTGVLDKADCAPRADTLRAMAAHYKKWWEKATNYFASNLGKERSTLIPDEDLSLYEPNAVVADAVAEVLGARHMTANSLMDERRVQNVWRLATDKPLTQLVHVLNHLAKPGGRFLVDGIGRYRVNKQWETLFGKERALRKTPTKDVPHVVTKPARDFLAQTISFALDARPHRGQGAEEIRLRIKQTPAAMRLLAGHAPTKAQIADALSAHSRGPNPRYLRVARGNYQNNPKYKKPK